MGDPPDSADACFAVMLSGQEVALKIQAEPFTREGGMHIMTEPVEIIELKFIYE
jgi:hypothetical protein